MHLMGSNQSLKPFSFNVDWLDLREQSSCSRLGPPKPHAPGLSACTLGLIL